MAYKQKNKWVASITLGGKKYRKTFSAKKYAQLWEQQKRREFELGVLDLQTTSYVEIKTLCENYLKDISQRARKTSAYQEKLRVKIILNYCDYKSIHCASEIDRDFWSGFIDWRRAGGAKPSTINIVRC